MAPVAQGHRWPGTSHPIMHIWRSAQYISPGPAACSRLPTTNLRSHSSSGLGGKNQQLRRSAPPQASPRPVLRLGGMECRSSLEPPPTKDLSLLFPAGGCEGHSETASVDQRDKNSLKAVLFSMGEVWGLPKSALAPFWTIISSMAGPLIARSIATFSATCPERSTRHASV